MNRPDGVGRCLECDYLLVGLETPRCPECGRPFDPADPRTMNMGRVPGWLARWMLRPSGWITVLACLLVVGPLLWTTRPPAGAWSASLVDFEYPRRLSDRRIWDRMDWPQRVRAVTVRAVPVLAVVWVLGLALRGGAWLRYRQSAAARAVGWQREGLVLMVILAGLGAVVYGWPYHVGRQWAKTWASFHDDQRRQPHSGFTIISFVWRFPELRPEQQLLVARTSLRWLPGPRERVAMLDLVSIHRPQALLATARDVLVWEDDPQLLRVCLRLIGLMDNGDDVPRLARQLRHADASVREAAAESIGLASLPSSPIAGLPTMPFGDVAQPAIKLWRLCPLVEARPQQQALPHEVRQWLESMAMSGESAEERIAAAKTLSMNPVPGHVLRLAEWRVWAEPAVSPAVAPLAAMAFAADPEWHRQRPDLVPHTLLRLETGKPMAARLTISGRDRGSGKAFPIRPGRACASWTGGRVAADQSEAAFWISSAPALGGTQPVTPGMPLFTDGCWIGAGSVWDRCIRIEGGLPATAEAWAGQHSGGFRIGIRMFSSLSAESFYSSSRMAPNSDAAAMLVSHHEGMSAAMDVTAAFSAPMTLPSAGWPMTGDDARATVLRWFKEAGFTEAEMAAFMQMWGPAIFDAEGMRVVVRLPTELHTRLCGVEIQPPPTTAARIGLVIQNVQDTRKGGRP